MARWEIVAGKRRLAAARRPEAIISAESGTRSPFSAQEQTSGEIALPELMLREITQRLDLNTGRELARFGRPMS